MLSDATVRTRLHAATSSIATVCDYAVEKDGQGFNATDASLGHFLAALDASEWTEDHTAAALGFLPTYRRQLDGSLDDIFAAARALDNDYRQARAAVLAQARAHRAAQRRKAQSYVHVTDDEVILGFPYSDVLVAESRQIPGRRFHGPDKTNRYPLRSLPHVAAFANKHGITIEPDVLAVLRDVLLHPEKYQPIDVTLDGHTLVIQAEYTPSLNSGLRAANNGRSSWDAQRRQHRVRLDSDPAGLLVLLRAHNLSLSPQAESALSDAAATAPQAEADLDATGSAITISHATAATADAIRRQLREMSGSCRGPGRGEPLTAPIHHDPAALLALIEHFQIAATEPARTALQSAADLQARNLTDSIATSGDEIAIPGLGVTLMPHQHAGVTYALRNRRLIVADEMGLGKTITSLATVAAANAFPAVVACKPDLTVNWVKEISKVLPGRRVFLATGMTPSAIPADAEIVVIGFSALGSRAKDARSERFLWAEEIIAHRPRALIVDEGHLGKEVSAARSRALASLGTTIAAADGIVLDLTGTPLVNRPRELAQQLVTLGYLAPKDSPASPAHVFGEFGGFLFRYCGPVNTGYGYTFNGHSHTAELHHRMRAWGLYLRRGQEALDLPSFTMSALVLDDSALDPDLMAEYRAAENAVVDDFTAQARDIADLLGTDPRDSRVMAEMGQQSAAHLVRLNALRQLVGRAKRPAVTAWVRNQIDQGEKVMIAAHHRSVVGAYARAFGGLKIQGGQSAEEKEADKATFQNAPVEQAPAITVAIGAGGVGHTLHAARLGIQAELCWTPGERAQMAKRIHRIGQTRPVTYVVAVAAGTIDESMWAMLESKQRVLDSVLDGHESAADDAKENAEDDASAVAAIAWALVERGLMASTSATVTS